MEAGSQKTRVSFTGAKKKSGLGEPTPEMESTRSVRSMAATWVVEEQLRDDAEGGEEL